MAKIDPEILAHLEWIGFVRPTGLVVSARPLVALSTIYVRVALGGKLFDGARSGSMSEHTICRDCSPMAF
jgi:hypothetical protein